MAMLFSFLLGWKQLKNFKMNTSVPDVRVSVIISVRNEAENIIGLLTDLARQTYQTDLFEIILVNDHSEDQTISNAMVFKDQMNIIFVDLKEGEEGKKTALQKGVSLSKGELIFTTDADCRLGKDWIKSFVQYYIRYHPNMIIGPVLFHGEKNIFEEMQSLEFTGLIASGAGACGIHMPVLCNGANLVYKSSLIKNLNNPFKINISSGDDIFWMLKIKKNNPGKILFLKSVDAIVYTKAQSDFNKFISQRKRWTSKSKYYTDTEIRVVAWIVFLFNLSLVLLFICSFLKPEYLKTFLVLFFAKCLTDFSLLYSFTHFFKKMGVLKWIVPVQFLYIFYSSMMAIFGNIGTFRWKGRLAK